MSRKASLTNWPERRRSPCFWLAAAGGAGLIKPAPGTWGSLLGWLIAILFLQFEVNILSYSLYIAGLYIASHIAIGWVQQAAGVDDAPEIVIDEVIGIWIALFPLVGKLFSWQDAILLFLLFRAFDILKPFPIGEIERSTGGAQGVLLDDVVAGILAAVLLPLAKALLGFTVYGLASLI